MSITEKELEELRRLRNEPDEVDVRYKQIIKQRLLTNNKIIFLIHNKELEDAEPDEYLGVNILPYYLIAPTQTNVKNYICFETSFDEVSRGNSVMKIQQIIFYILCHHSDISIKLIPISSSIDGMSHGEEQNVINVLKNRLSP